MFFMTRAKSEMISPDAALPGRAMPLPTAPDHHIFGTPITSDVPAGQEVAMFGMGCFWGVERMFWKLDGVTSTMVGYAGGFTPNATYEEVCSGKTGHNEVVRVVYDPAIIAYDQLLQVFWEGHDPTQGMQQGNDRGTQYRSGIYTYTDAQAAASETSKIAFGPRLSQAGYGMITTEVLPAPTF
jgi:peptide-methionine (S)-S-oxide reductase